MSSKNFSDDLDFFNTFNSVEPMTPARLKSFEGLEHFSDQQALELIHQMEAMAKAIVTCCRNS